MANPSKAAHITFYERELLLINFPVRKRYAQGYALEFLHKPSVI